MLDAGDYLGLSAYGSGYPVQGISRHDMEIALYTLAYELRFFGINLKDYMTKEVLLVEMVRDESQATWYSSYWYTMKPMTPILNPTRRHRGACEHASVLTCLVLPVWSS